MHSSQSVELVFGPGWIWSAGDVPVSAVVRHEHTVLLQGPENHLRALRKSRDIKVRPEPHAHTHWWQIRIHCLTCKMRGGRNVSPSSAANRESQRVPNLPLPGD